MRVEASWGEDSGVLEDSAWDERGSVLVCVVATIGIILEAARDRTVAKCCEERERSGIQVGARVRELSTHRCSLALLVSSRGVVGGVAVGVRLGCVDGDDFAVLVEVDTEPAVDVLAADVVVPLGRVADRFVRFEAVFFEEASGRDRVAVGVGVDIAPVVLLLKGDERDFVVVSVVREHHRFGVFEVLVDNRGVRCELSVFPDRDELVSVEDVEAVGGREFN